jgi:F-type H+-transporting ATPase subunit b
MRYGTKSLILSGLLLLCLCAPAFASEGHGAKFNLTEMIAAVANFAIFAFIVVYFGRKGIASFYKNRAETQMAAVKEAEALLQEASAIHEKIKKQRDNLDQETKEMVEAAKQRAAQQGAEIVETAKKQAERMVADARRTIDTEIDAAKTRLREELVNEAVKVAENDLTGRLDENGQKKLVDQFMTKMEDLN